MENQIKLLDGLKTKAIAVTVPETFHHAEIEFGELGIFLTNPEPGGREIVHGWLMLPPGEWVILGRVLDTFDQRNLIEQLYQTADHIYAWAQWHKYCAKEGLTNEIILIEK